MKSPLKFASLSIALIASTAATRADVLFSDNFDSNTSSLYNIAASSGAANYRVTYGYDYGAAYSGNLGIPSAPHTIGGTTSALKLEVNILGAGAMSLALSPLQTFAGDYSMKFDLWMNSIGPFPLGGTGSTEHFSAGVGYNGSTFQNKTSGSGTWFAADSDGGYSGTSSTANDYMAMVGNTQQAIASGVYAAGTATGASSAVDNSNAYYTSKFPGHTPPASQFNILTNQTGTMANGTLGFAWHSVEIGRTNNVATLKIDDFLIASVTNAATLASDSVFVGYWDTATSLGNTNVSFALIDNLEISGVPEPSTIALGFIGGAAALGCAIRRKK